MIDSVHLPAMICYIIWYEVLQAHTKTRGKMSTDVELGVIHKTNKYLHLYRKSSTVDGG